MDRMIDVVFSREIRSKTMSCDKVQSRDHESLYIYIFIKRDYTRDDVIIGVIVIGVELHDNMRFPILGRHYGSLEVFSNVPSIHDVIGSRREYYRRLIKDIKN